MPLHHIKGSMRLLRKLEVSLKLENLRIYTLFYTSACADDSYSWL
jgi:hypothetical protein